MHARTRKPSYFEESIYDEHWIIAMEEEIYQIEKNKLMGIDPKT